MRKIAPYGCWKSPITAAQLASGAVRYGELQGMNGAFYWIEGRPQEAGRNVIVNAKPGSAAKDILPAPYSARSRVHEYGGGAFLACEQGVYFVNADNQDFYLLAPDGAINRITDAPGWRFADAALDKARNRLLAVAELHGAEDSAPQNMLAAISLDPAEKGRIEILAEGKDFYACPRLSPDGGKLAWIEWSLPHMPWENSQLCIGEFAAHGKIINKRLIAGGGDYAAGEPRWGADGMLYFISDQGSHGAIRLWDGDNITSMAWPGHEFGQPLWGLAPATYAIHDNGEITALCYKDGALKLAVSDNGKWSALKTGARQIEALARSGPHTAIIAATDNSAPAVIVLNKKQQYLSRKPAAMDNGNISQGKLLAFTTTGGLIAHGIYYPPRSAEFAAAPDEKPPLIISAHGGPTGMADRGLKLKIQFWTSRGFAFFDIDYRGSTGYGRAWRDALAGNWGLFDVEDMINGARHMVAEGLGDPKRLLISGSSAGGFTVLATLCASSIFAAGASYYGIGDLQKLLDCTHKFESGYLHNLLGGDIDAFSTRSPINNAKNIKTPVIFFQGADDPVVPPSQSRDMTNSLKANNIATCYIEFDGESHGFRRAETIIRALNSEYSFYAKILGLKPLENLPDIDIISPPAPL